MKKFNQMDYLKKALKKTAVSLIYISMPNCSVCQAVKPRLDQLAQEKNIPIFHLDAFEVPLVASEFQVMTAPAVLIDLPQWRIMV